MQKKEKEHINIVVIGHVDSGKSTTCGHLLFRLGTVNKREIDRLAQQAIANNKQTFEFAYVMDKTKASREKGITIDISTLKFETPSLNYTIIDAPGHKDFIKNMITGTSAADVALLIVSAAQGEFEAGISKEGSTREHALLAFTLGVKQIIVGINKIDAPTVNFAKDRIEEIKNNAGDFLKKIGFDPAKTSYVPISGYKGYNLIEKAADIKEFAWYTGPTLLQVLDAVTVPKRPVDKPLRLPVQNVYKIDGIGTVAVGRVEAGTLKSDMKVCFAPCNKPEQKNFEVKSIERHHEKIDQAIPGDNIGFNIRNLATKDIQKGYICGDLAHPPKECESFVAQVIILNHPGEIKAGYCPVVNIHTAQVSCLFQELLQKIDRRSNKVLEDNPKLLKTGDCALIRMVPQKPLCVEPFTECPPLGRFAVRDMKHTVAIGIIKEVLYKEK